MGNILKVVMMIMLATCAQLIMTQSNSTDGNGEEFAVVYGHLGSSDVALLAATATCTEAGVFPVPENCSLYQVCTTTSTGAFLSSIGDCENLNFDPVSVACSSTYVCSNCTEPGFYCNTNTTFTMCAAAGVAYINGQACPPGYYCNQKCVSPCLNYIPDC